MSTLKSSNDHLTLNADGTSKDIKFQADGTEKMVLKSDGKLGVGTATPLAKTHSSNGVPSGFTAADGGADELLISDSGSEVGMTIACTSVGTINFADGGASRQGRIRYEHATDNIQLWSANAVRLRVDSDGIKFGTDTAAANALSDYEEGSWNPNYSGSSGSVGSGDVSEWTGFYTKIGRLVTVQFKITLTNNGSWGGEVRLTGLPFTPNMTMPHAGSCETAYVNYNGGSVGNIGIYITSSQTYFRPRYTHDNSAAAMIQCSEVADNGGFKGMFTYTTNA